MQGKKQRGAPPHFPRVPLTEALVRRGKHSKIISEILSDLESLDALSAIKIDLAQVGEKKADLRSALHRAAKTRNVKLLTTSDEKHLYVFQRPPKRK